MRGFASERARAEEVRRRLRDGGWLAGGRKVLHEGNVVIFPLVDGADPGGSDGTIVEREFPIHDAVGQSYRDLLVGVPEELAGDLPRAFDVVGDLVLVRLPPTLEPWTAEIGSALLAFVPGARAVGWDRGVHGPDRRRTIVPIAGSGGWRTTHRENGIAIEVDLERAYFSPRLAREHARVASQVRDGETVLDLCCGVGPFALTVAALGRAASIVAVDQNPAAIELLRASAEHVSHGDRIRIVEGSIPDALPPGIAGDRAILNLPHEGIKYLASVGSSVGPGGSLHYYEMTERHRRNGRPIELVATLRPAGPFRPIEDHVVHEYAPTIDLVAYTFERGPE